MITLIIWRMLGMMVVIVIN